MAATKGKVKKAVSRKRREKRAIVQRKEPKNLV